MNKRFLTTLNMYVPIDYLRNTLSTKTKLKDLDFLTNVAGNYHRCITCCFYVVF